MLDGLDDVDWGSLVHAHGGAGDVPGLIRGMLSADAEARARVVDELFGTLWHQGSVYSASAAALPFLYEMLGAPEIRERSAIAHLIASIADGSGFLTVHAAGEFGEAMWREILGEEGKSLEEELWREAVEREDIRLAASAGLMDLLPFLGDDDPEVRRAVAIALGHFPEHASGSLPAIEAALASETDEEVGEALIDSRGRLRWWLG